jgi:hypothetical protein
VNVPGYRCIHRTDCSSGRNSEGILIFAKDRAESVSDCDLDQNVQHTIPSIVSNFSSNGHCLFVRFQISSNNIIVAYKSPQFSNSLFLNTLEDTLRSIHGNLIVLGDFNMDLRKSEGRKILQLFSSRSLESKLNVQSFSTDGGTHIDYCFSNIANVEAWFYETYYSYHKAICVVLPKK